MFFEDVTHLMLWGIQEKVSRSFGPRWEEKSIHMRHEQGSTTGNVGACVSFEFWGRFFVFLLFMIPRHSLSLKNEILMPIY